MYYVSDMETLAVDKLTQDYWTSYFGDYGKLWVRDIPRYIRAAIQGDLRKQATAGTPPPEAGSESRVTPLGYAITADRLTLEGRWVGNVKQGRRIQRVAKLFSATFTHDGELVGLNAITAPAS